MANLKIRFASSEVICDLFSPILTMDVNSDQVKTKTKLLVSKYPKDLDADDLNEEILHMKSVQGIMFHSKKDPLMFLNTIYEKKLEVIFVNLCTGIKLFLHDSSNRIYCYLPARFHTIPVTVSTATFQHDSSNSIYCYLSARFQ
ncbi:hypothetical protein PR048_029875 [Dryococelus australis]|uniref:Uncharacterized protein n=1 Tax=Dryococelus australis TaxID=614101 RepID=A0ABQ9G7C5_9NEOP|nr:hypothetical protein PR048_029875 [Dryococelus australis]